MWYSINHGIFHYFKGSDGPHGKTECGKVLIGNYNPSIIEGKLNPDNKCQQCEGSNK